MWSQIKRIWGKPMKRLSSAARQEDCLWSWVLSDHYLGGALFIKHNLVPKTRLALSAFFCISTWDTDRWNVTFRLTDKLTNLTHCFHQIKGRMRLLFQMVSQMSRLVVLASVCSSMFSVSSISTRVSQVGFWTCLPEWTVGLWTTWFSNQPSKLTSHRWMSQQLIVSLCFTVV